MIQVAECHSAADVRALLRRFRPAPSTPIVRIPPVQERIHTPAPVVNSAPELCVRVVNPQIREILEQVCLAHRVSFTDMKGLRRFARIVHARQEAMYELRDQAELSLPHIGRLFNRDHTTVGHGIAMHAHRHGLPLPADMGPSWNIELRRKRGTL